MQRVLRIMPRIIGLIAVLASFLWPALVSATDQSEILKIASDLSSNITWTTVPNSPNYYSILGKTTNYTEDTGAVSLPTVDNSSYLQYKSPAVSNISTIEGFSKPIYPVGNITSLTISFDTATNGTDGSVNWWIGYSGANNSINWLWSGVVGTPSATNDWRQTYNITGNLTPADLLNFHFVISGNSSGTGNEYLRIYHAYATIKYKVANIISVTNEQAFFMINPVPISANINSTLWDGNVTDYGFRVGSSNGTWDYSNSVITHHNIYGTYNSSNNIILDFLSGLSPNQTMYYQAFAAGYDANAAYKIFYGDVKSFTTGSILFDGSNIVYTTNITQLVDPFTQKNSVLLGGSLLQATNPITTWGILVDSNVSSLTLATANVQFSYTGLATLPELFTNWFDYPSGWTSVSARAFMINNLGNITYGNIVSTNITQIIIDTIITLNTPTVIGNNAVLYASLNKATFANQAGFSYGTSSNNNTWISVINTTNSVNPIYSIQSGFLTLLPSTTYYYEGQVFTDKWIYSPMGNFTTSASFNATASSPQIVTYPASWIGDTSFNTSVYINGSNLTSVGIQIKGQQDNTWQTVFVTAVVGGTYNLTISGLSPNTTYTYQGWGQNIYGNNTGIQYLVTTLPIYDPNLFPVVPSGTSISLKVTDFSSLLRDEMKSLGMDNPTGHWAFMGLIMAIFSLPSIFIALYIYVVKRDKFLANAIIIIAIILDVVTLGTFLFSGLLGMWAVFALVFAVVALILILVGPILNGSKAPSNG